MKILRNVAAVGALGLAVAACGGTGTSAVKGDRDDVKNRAAVKELSHKGLASSTTCTRKVAGKCKSYKTTKTWKKVVDRKAKPALYCVELDNVNGSAKDDDVWYTVQASTYWSAAGKQEGSPMKFTPIHTGCW